MSTDRAIRTEQESPVERSQGPERSATEPADLPLVVATSVIRSTRQGQSHGGVFLIDLATGEHLQVIDWNDGAIDWEGRGGDRGLRGIAFHGGRVFLAASDEIFVFDSLFRRLGSITSPYLKHCHEICIFGDTLYLTSTGYDAILEFDLERWAFRRGVCLRPLRLKGGRFTYHRLVKGLASRLARLHPACYRLLTLHLSVRRFDPDGPDGPQPLDFYHVNNVHADDYGFSFAGVDLDGIFHCDGWRLCRVATLPRGTHNARIEAGVVLYQDTEGDRVEVRAPGSGTPEHFLLPTYAEAELVHAHLGRDHARPAFGRGLCVAGDLLIAGSSPATVSAFRRGTPAPLRTVTLTRDVRNAIHGLEVWPHDRRLADWIARREAAQADAATEAPAPAAG